MNIGYFRKTKKSVDEAVSGVKDALKKRNISVTGETTLASGSVLVQFLNPAKTDTILQGDRMLLGLVPMVIMVEKQDDGVSVGTINPQILAGTPAADDLEGVIESVIEETRALVQEAAGVGEPKVKKITLYSTATCPYCRMEKDYLEKNNVKFELVMVDADRKAAEDMIRKSGQTGVPQTEIGYDDGDFEIVMGFDKARLDQVLSIGK